ncbi:MAG: tRNA (pseudouridine(54)-N(1))-methyltransferase TrmY, partial [Candidatus Thermoplasmatota archaeon]|nr:tRNA (pseudouridine(54)-N(1))-methyltransferase TrmY [Candidatus Thermoplasmatota archaeon]
MAPTRTFLLVANRAIPTGQVPLDDLPASGGRFDLVARFVVQSLLTSHGVREDTEVILLFTNTPDEPKALKVRGDQVLGLRPDERTAASKLNQALGPVAMPVWQACGEGFASRSITLQALLDEVPGPVVLLDEAGEDLQD